MNRCNLVICRISYNYYRKYYKNNKKPCRVIKHNYTIWCDFYW